LLSYSNVEPSGQELGEEIDGELPGYPLSRRRTCGVHGRNPKLLTLAFVCVCVGGGGVTAQLGPSRLIVEVCRSHKTTHTHPVELH